MNLVGDLERFIATNLYQNRVPIAIGLAAAVVSVLIVARRRGWLGAARRHPARTAAAIALALVVALPSAWYLGSPLFIRTSLQEPPPTRLADSTEAPTPAPANRGSAGPTNEPNDSPVPVVAEPRTGQFHGADDFHFGSGSATLIETAPGEWTVRFEKLSVRNGPDLYVYVSADPAGYDATAIELGQLKATDGSFNMDLPAGTNPSRAASVVIWCKQFAVQFAVAPLTG